VLEITSDNQIISGQYSIFLVNFICWFVGNQATGWIPQSNFEVWAPPYLYLPAKKVQNVFIICLLVGCMKHTWSLFYFTINSLYMILWHHYTTFGTAPCITLVYGYKTGNCGTGQIMLWQANYYFNHQTLWQVIIYTLFQALLVSILDDCNCFYYSACAFFTLWQWFLMDILTGIQWTIWQKFVTGVEL